MLEAFSSLGMNIYATMHIDTTVNTNHLRLRNSWAELQRVAHSGEWRVSSQPIPVFHIHQLWCTLSELPRQPTTCTGNDDDHQVDDRNWANMKNNIPLLSLKHRVPHSWNRFLVTSLVQRREAMKQTKANKEKCLEGPMLLLPLWGHLAVMLLVPRL